MVAASPLIPVGKDFGRWSGNSQHCRHDDPSCCIVPLRIGSGPWFYGTVSAASWKRGAQYLLKEIHGHAEQFPSLILLPAGLPEGGRKLPGVVSPEVDVRGVPDGAWPVIRSKPCLHPALRRCRDPSHAPFRPAG